MTDSTVVDVEKEVCDWWRTDIVDMKPGVIRYRGYAIEDLIGKIGFAEMVWLMMRGELPNTGQARLLDTVLMSAVDHGPQAPSIAIARMASTCGVSLNNAMASALNVLGDVHGGAGEQAASLYLSISDLVSMGDELNDATAATLDAFFEAGNKFVPGFGHRFHPIDPRAPKLLAEVERAAANGHVDGRFGKIARAVERDIERRKSRKIPMNIDGATAAIYCELGFPPTVARGLFCLSRSVGILAHAWEQTEQGGRNKGPIPRQMIWTYDGPDARLVPEPLDRRSDLE